MACFSAPSRSPDGGAADTGYNPGHDALPDPPTPEVKLLVANRGEIAVRVIRTARTLGIPTVAVFSEADRGALHTRLADEAVEIGPGPSAQSYLDGARLLAAAARTGATAVHPGYGFLSERAEFAAAVLAAGLLWVGPSPASMAAMADKAAARRTAGALGLPLTAGVEAIEPGNVLALGLPVVIKAIAGGGGRGMRVVRHERELAEALEGAASEALAAFGDGRLYAERFVEPARHVEVQSLGDGRGGALALGVRECSVQRRGQKLLEETPVPGMSEALAAALEADACTLVRGVAYLGAGTVEFLLSPDGRHSFLEMNTRIQVEAGITELVTGLDLVAEQLRLALGGELPERPAIRGHAMEVRICAEDPRLGFAPSSGRVTRLRAPAGPGIRFDAGVAEGDAIPELYDSLLAKVMAFGPSRESAIGRMRGALDELEVAGVATTAGVLRAVLVDPAFLAGGVGTRWLEPWASARSPSPALLAAAAAAFTVERGAPPARAGREAPTVSSPWATLGRWP